MKCHSNVRRGLLIGWLLVFSVAFLPAAIFAQAVGGTLLGTVKDPSGAILVGAEVIIQNADTGIGRTLFSNETGIYSAANLQPGTYEVVVKLPGFAPGGKREITVNVGAQVVIDIEMKLANVSSTVDVTTSEAHIELASATISNTVEGTTIRQLPLNGRDWTQLATLEAGISSIGTGGGAARDGSGVKLTVSGARPTENNFRLDGISLNDSSNTTPGSILGTNMGVEAVREFSVVSNNYSAEYGRATGGVINAVTKSGTNAVHGTLFYFGRNSALDARNFFDGTKPSFRRHQFGAAAGGPIVQNRTFWFANFEGINQFLSTTSISNTLSEAARSGQLSTGAVVVSPDIARIFPLLPLPNGQLLGAGDTGQYISQRDTLSRGRYILGKIDHKLSDKGSLTATYFFDDADSNAPDAYHTKRTADTSRKQMTSIEYTRIISPQLLSASRIGFSRSATESGVITEVYNPLLEDASLGFIPGLNIGATSVPGLSIPGGGPGATNITELFFNSFQFHENLFITKGTHAIKLGASVERMQYNMSIPNLNGGSFSFGSIPDYLRNRPSSFGALYPGSDTRRGLRQTLVSGYIQDDIRVKSNFSLNLGFRYEFLTIPTEVNGKVALLHDVTDPEVKVGGPVHDRNPTKRNFAPRVGIVWDPFKSGKTSVRAGFGVFDSLPLLWLYDTPLTRSAPFFVQGVTTAPPVGSYPKQAFTLLRVSDLRTAYIEVNPPRAYSMKWNLNIQRQIHGWIADIGYTGSRGVHLPIVERNMNVVMPVLTEDGTYVVPAGAKKLNPNFSTINTTDTWNADSYYHGFQGSVKKSWRQGVQIQSSYAWSKSIDTSSSTGSSNATTGYPSAVALVTPLLPGLNRGLSDFDLTHNFTSNLVWEIPFARTLRGVPGAVLSGWQLGTIYKAQSGTPFSVVLNSDRAGTGTDTTGASLGQRPNLVLSDACATLTNPGDPNRWIKTECFTYPAQFTLGNVGRNTLRKAGISNLDFSLSKNFKHGETTATQLRFELFNALNHTNFAAPNIVVFDNQGRNPATAGRVTSTSTESRRVQVGLKVNF